MAKIIDEAKALNLKRPYCIECGKRLKDYRSLRCRGCFYMLIKELKPFKARFGEDNPYWKGDKVSYSGLHKWIGRYKKKLPCEICGSHLNVQASNISRKYKRDINDFRWLCAKCHVRVDGTINNLNYKRRKTNGKNI